MTSTRQTLFSLLSGALLLFSSGCAAVDPQPDYDRAVQYIAQATGQGLVYRPGREDLVASQTQALLADGITAQAAVQICLLNNPRLQAAFFTVGIASADVVQSGLFSNPSLAVSPRFPDSLGPVQVEASVAQNIVELWQLPVRKREAEQNRDQAIFDLAREVSTTMLEARTAYFQALKADRAQVLIQDNVASRSGSSSWPLCEKKRGSAVSSISISPGLSCSKWNSRSRPRPCLAWKPGRR